MKIQGIGVVNKKEAMSILTREGKEAVKNGEITEGELGTMYKLEQVKKVCKFGGFGDTFLTKKAFAVYSDSAVSHSGRMQPEHFTEATTRTAKKRRSELSKM